MKRTYIVIVEKITNELDQKEINVQIEPEKKLNPIDNLLYLLMCLAYLILLSTGIINPTHPISIFMAFFSLNISICYTDSAAKRLLKIIPLKIDFSSQRIWLWLYVVILAIILTAICLFIQERPCDIPYVTKENIGNIITWVSIVFFVYDKVKHPYFVDLSN